MNQTTTLNASRGINAADATDFRFLIDLFEDFWGGSHQLDKILHLFLISGDQSDVPPYTTCETAAAQLATQVLPGWTYRMYDASNKYGEKTEVEWQFGESVLTTDLTELYAERPSNPAMLLIRHFLFMKHDLSYSTAH
ncbi:hypothetical protein RB623_06165 [Mesorhizobium sp. LHD-90]|uniref:hypothetical protein n=1 Tax=Mesorhizobium sp. LHD-90 TaxID=3071414 RepID=UPI0027DFC35A|nr:hypothetical protein [Mesorhizobium sp. LHD-90]MDQ6433633.1 hypothetical protein [Mesorhizobium sp. LHD-90]